MTEDIKTPWDEKGPVFNKDGELMNPYIFLAEGYRQGYRQGWADTEARYAELKEQLTRLLIKGEGIGDYAQGYRAALLIALEVIREKSKPLEVEETKIDYQKPFDKICPECGGGMTKQRKNSKWLLCSGCFNQYRVA